MREREKKKERKKERERRHQSPFDPSVASLCHPWFTTANLSYRFPIFETSATALCGTTGICLFVNGCERIQKRGKGTHHVVTIISLQLSSLGPSTEYNMLTRSQDYFSRGPLPKNGNCILMYILPRFLDSDFTSLNLSWAIQKSKKYHQTAPAQPLPQCPGQGPKCHGCEGRSWQVTDIFWTWNWAL
jgi:hypothetical protein